MRILFFGTYNPSYSRNRILLKGLRANGVEVMECRVSPSSRLQLPWLILKYLSLRMRRQSFDVLFVAFPGQEVMLLARLLTRRPIVFDMFTSHYEGYVQDRATVQPGSIRARWFHWLDTAAARRADIVLTDTDAHAEFFAQEFGIPREKMHRVFVGADTDLFSPATPLPGTFTVHWHGSYIPLQGADVVVRAASFLRDSDMRIRMIGKGQTFAQCQKIAKELGVTNIEFIPSVPYTRLAELLKEAHICLGIFGRTEKAQRVIPNKVFEALAAHRPLITADTPATKELLDDTSALLVPSNDPQALADAIIRLKNDDELRSRLADAGSRALKERATPELLGRQVLQTIETIL